MLNKKINKFWVAKKKKKIGIGGSFIYILNDVSLNIFISSYCVVRLFCDFFLICWKCVEIFFLINFAKLFYFLISFNIRLFLDKFLGGRRKKNYGYCNKCVFGKEKKKCKIGTENPEKKFVKFTRTTFRHQFAVNHQQLIHTLSRWSVFLITRQLNRKSMPRNHLS